ILALYVLSNQKSREPKRLYKKLGKYYEKLQADYLKKPSDNKKQKTRKNKKS
ncbi:MAG: deoxyhypusine synthase, partial [Nitrosopumilus sp. CG10_big_fil_rev_8_21_14_0_10_33_7]